jgi:hypothetical protein
MMNNVNRFIIPLQEKIQLLASNKKILIIIGGCLAGFLLLMLLLVISLRMNHNRNEMQQDSQELHQVFISQEIKAEELFLPSEPDFIPEAILDREPNSSWTDEDAELFWSDPLDGNADVWKNRIFKAVDDIMENIP